MNRKRILTILLLVAWIAPVALTNAQSETWSDVRRQNHPAIVYLKTDIHYPNGLRVPIEGTGFVVHADGYILTCLHVVPSLSDEEKQAGATLSATASIGGRGETKRPFYIIDPDPNKDLALLKLQDQPPRPIPTVKVNFDSVLGPDQDVYALGFPAANPGSLDGTPGTIRSSFRDLWVTNASINPGNSGGPVFSKDGQVVGVSKGALPNSNQMNVVIPIRLVKSMFDDRGIKIDEGKPTVEIYPEKQPDGDRISMNFLPGTTFQQAVRMIALNQQKSIRWISCTDELKQALIEPGGFSAKGYRRLIESVAETISVPRRIKSVSQDDEGGRYEIRCN